MSGARIVVLGLGNLMRTDDAVGMLAVQQLRADARVPDTVTLVDGGTLGLDLLYPLDGATHLLALDAIESDAAPGTLLRFAGDEIADLPISKSVHLLGFSDLIGAMRLTGSAPEEIVVLGVQPDKIEWGTQLTPTVGAALPDLLEAALTQVEQWRREMPVAAPREYTESVQACAEAR
jgi:hydrogenase maturation protease